MSKSGQMSGPERTATEIMSVRITALLLLVAALSVFVLWTANPVGSAGETTFALYLSIDLASFAMISYIHRSVAAEGRIGSVPLLAGCCLILLLLLASFYL